MYSLPLSDSGKLKYYDRQCPALEVGGLTFDRNHLLINVLEDATMREHPHYRRNKQTNKTNNYCSVSVLIRKSHKNSSYSLPK